MYARFFLCFMNFHLALKGFSYCSCTSKLHTFSSKWFHFKIHVHAKRIKNPFSLFLQKHSLQGQKQVLSGRRTIEELEEARQPSLMKNVLIPSNGILLHSSPTTDIFFAQIVTATMFGDSS